MKNALHHAIRQLHQHRGFSFLVIVMLAVGIGATTAMFSMLHQVVLSRLSVDEPDRIVNLGAPGPKGSNTTCTMAGDCEQVFSYPMFRDLEARQTVLSEIAGHYATAANLAYRNQTQTSRALLVSGSYFAALRVRPALGRLLGAEDDAHVGESPVAVLSYDYWQSALGSSPDAVGQAIVVNGQTLTIVGVAPEGFSGTTFGWRPSVYVPLTMRWLMEANVPRSDTDRRAYWVYSFGRLKPGVSLAQAREALNALYGGIINEVDAPLNTGLSDDAMVRFRARQITVEAGAWGQSIFQKLSGPIFLLLLGVAAVVLMVACFNIANLMYVRGATRAGEMAIRSSLGASRARLLRDLLLEAAVLAVAGGLASVPVAMATLGGVSALVPAQLAGQIVLKLEPVATAFAAALSLGTVLLFGLLPALRTSATRPVAAMPGRSAVGVRRRLLLGRSLATAQIVFSMLLLVLGGLFAQSLANLSRAKLGMNVESLVTFSVSPQRSGYSKPQGKQLFDTLQRELAAQPGVTSVGSSLVPLLSFAYWGGAVKIDGDHPGPAADSQASTNEVNEAFFRTFSIPLLEGRMFTDADAVGTPRVAVVNEAFVRKFHLEGGALGKHVSIPDRPLGSVEIVGVIADAKYATVRADPPPQLITPHAQDENLGGLVFYVRAALPPDDVMKTIRRVVTAADASLPVADLWTMDKVVDDNLFTERLIAILAGGLGALATLLTATGLYGVLAYSVAQRTRELGLRLALGATVGSLRNMMLRQVAMVALIGMPIGLAFGVALGQVAKGLLFELTGYNPTVLVLAVALLLAVVFAAAYVPARRASSIEPMQALRYE